MLPVRKEFEYTPFATYTAYTMAFVYPQKRDAYALKGDYKEIQNFIHNRVQTEGAALVNFNCWRDKKARESTYIFGLEHSVVAEVMKMANHGTRRFRFTVNFGGALMVEKMLRRRPRKWLKDLDAFVIKESPYDLYKF